MLNRNYLLEKLRNTNEVCIGTWSVIPSTILIDVICSTGLDFVIIDAEHGPVGFEQAQEMVISCESREVSPIMRVPEVDRNSILKALEIGVHGIQVPNIEKLDQLDKLIEFSKYPPVGKRGFSPFTRACGYSSDFSKEMIAKSNSNTLVNIHIEGKLGVENIDSILENPIFDVCFLGLFDISSYLGRPGEINHPEIVALFKQLVTKINNAGKIAGAISNSKDQLKFLIENNVRYITHSVDCHIIRDVYKNLASIVRQK